MNREDWGHIFNNRAAYEEFYIFQFRRLYRYGKKICQKTTIVEDAIQEAFLDLWTKQQKLDHVTSLESYLFSTFRYILLKRLKEEQKQFSDLTSFSDTVFSVEFNIIAQEENSERTHRLKEAYNSLTDRQKEAIFSRFYQNLSYEEIAQILNISIKGTYKLMARALSMLKSELLL